MKDGTALFWWQGQSGSRKHFFRVRLTWHGGRRDARNDQIQPGGFAGGKPGGLAVGRSGSLPVKSGDT